MVIRAIGPTLEAAGISGALQDPMLELYNSEGTLIASNNNWRDTQRAQLEAKSLGPKDTRESAILIALSTGSYTAVVRGVNDSTGIALVEVYNLN